MMRRTALATALFLVPLAVLALDYQHGDDDYTDAETFSVAEQAAISVLTDVGAVGGNPDGSFAPDRTLNRAEFAKIAMLSFNIDGDLGAIRSCFPDVTINDWFNVYVCRAKDMGAIEGNPDGLYHPEREVNLAEATKILVELAGYNIPEPPANERGEWYRAYLLAAEEKGVGLPNSILPSHFLTRGQMARLAAAFVAEEEGELDEYRDAERGRFGGSSSSTSSVSSVSSASSVSSSSRSSAASSSATLYPARSRFLITGTTTPLILGGNVTSTDEASVLRIARLTLRREILSIDKVLLVDALGNTIVELIPDTNDNEDNRKWLAETPTSTYSFAANAPVKVGVRLVLAAAGDGGSSNELVEIESFSLQTEGSTTATTKILFPDSQVYPVHQTAFGRITTAQSTLPSPGTLPVGTQKTIASFRLKGETAPNQTVRVTGAEFILSTTNVNVSNIRIIEPATGVSADCGLERLNVTRIVCPGLPEGYGSLSSTELIVSIVADVALSSPGTGSLSVLPEERGHIGDAGTFTWTDGSGQFNWIEEDVPFGGETSWTVMQ